MYHRESAGGGEPQYWEATWADGAFAEALRFCDSDPLRPLFERYAPPGTRMLEGGCGRGQYVVYYSARGVRVVGLDFARATLGVIRRHERSLALCGGDVAALPFRSESFDVYYSGGVVEHFEAGSDEALREARRVLNAHGVLLISVPYLSPLRRVVSWFKRGDRRFVDAPTVDGSKDNRVFFQYAYAPREFARLVERAGFRVVAKRGYAILWGLMETPFASWAFRHLRRDPKARHEARPPVGAVAPGPASTGPSLLKRVVVSEDDSVPILGLFVRFSRWAAANMMMYICVPAEDTNVH